MYWLLGASVQKKHLEREKDLPSLELAMVAMDTRRLVEDRTQLLCIHSGQKWSVKYGSCRGKNQDDADCQPDGEEPKTRNRGEAEADDGETQDNELSQQWLTLGSPEQCQQASTQEQSGKGSRLGLVPQVNLRGKTGLAEDAEDVSACRLSHRPSRMAQTAARRRARGKPKSHHGWRMATVMTTASQRTRRGMLVALGKSTIINQTAITP